jgi:CheY-like chemotaxis protein
LKFPTASLEISIQQLRSDLLLVSSGSQNVQLEIALGGSVRKKMLVIEDEKIDAISIGRVLKQQFPNVTLEILTNGEQALDWIQRFRPDTEESISLVVMDLTIPRMSGLDLISEFKGHAQLRRVPIVIFSGNDSPQAIGSAYASGASGYLVKPGSSAEMLEVLRKTLNYWLDANRLPAQ